MTRTVALAWKEWREIRWPAAAGLALFLGAPALGAWWTYVRGAYPRFELTTSPLVLVLGGLSAALLGVAAGARDFRAGVEEFWRSCPVGVGRWWAVKYAVGLAAAVAVCGLPLVAELLADGRYYRGVLSATANVLGWGPAYWAAAFSLGFVSACLVRRPGHAAAAAVAGFTLLHVLPVMFPALEWFGLPERDDRGSVWGSHLYRLAFAGGTLAAVRQEQIAFVAGMAGVAAASFGTAVVAARRGWVVRAGRRTLFAAVGGAGLSLFATAAFQLGNNLPVLAEVRLEARERVTAVHTDGRAGVVLTVGYDPARPGYRPAARPLAIGPSGLSVGPPRRLPVGVRWGRGGTSSSYWTADHPRFAFVAWHEQVGPIGSMTRFGLTAVALDGDPTTDAEHVELTLWEEEPPSWFQLPGGIAPIPYRISLCGYGGKLYVSGGTRTATLDITPPTGPRLLNVGPRSIGTVDILVPDPVSALLPVLDDVPAKVRLEAAVNGRFKQVLDSDVIYQSDDNAAVAAARLVDLVRPGATDSRWRHHTRGEVARGEVAELKRVSRWRQSELERSVDGYAWDSITAAGGRVYLGWGTYRLNGSGNARVTVVDFRDPTRPRRAGHFVVPGGGSPVVRPLADGRALIGGGEKLYLVGPPPD